MNAASVYASQQKVQQNEQIALHLPLVKRIALHLLARLPSSVELDDLQQSGLLGLLSAARSYSPDQGASFETYAGIRIKGAMLDELRKLSWAPRSVHEKARRLAGAVREVEARNGGQAADQEIATELGVSLDEYHSLLNETASCQLLLLEDTEESHRAEESEAGPEALMQDQRFKAALMASIDELPEKEKMMMALYYQEDLNLREIGQVLEVSESRVSQIHSQALTRIRAKMVDWT
ncbi:MAG: RNA polymerase sigma factor FliA [Candidatus Azotimanducaceae bacterium]|jgi:RNA polymerase sigma factor for flagellar operon FliA